MNVNHIDVLVMNVYHGLVLEHELDAEALNDLNSIGAEFHDREDLIYECIAGELWPRSFCLKSLKISPREGEFLHHGMFQVVNDHPVYQSRRVAVNSNIVTCSISHHRGCDVETILNVNDKAKREKRIGVFYGFC